MAKVALEKCDQEGPVVGRQAYYRLSGKWYPWLDTGLAPASSDFHGILSSQRVKPHQTTLVPEAVLPAGGAWGLEGVGGGECWCWGALDPLNLGEGRSACLSSLGVYPELRAVAWVAPLAGLWRCPGRKEVQSWHCPTLLGQDWGWGAGVSQEPEEPG